jgi:hypothetical protein
MRASRNWWCVSVRNPDTRAQLATSLVEAAVGALLILSVVAGFLWVPAGGTGEATTAALDRTADDALSVLAAEPPAGRGSDRLAAACRSPESFATERDALDRRLEAVLPTAVFGRLETPHGTVGPPQPDGVPAGRGTRLVAGCPVTLRVWSV